MVKAGAMLLLVEIIPSSGVVNVGSGYVAERCTAGLLSWPHKGKAFYSRPTVIISGVGLVFVY